MRRARSSSDDGDLLRTERDVASRHPERTRGTLTGVAALDPAESRQPAHPLRKALRSMEEVAP